MPVKPPDVLTTAAAMGSRVRVPVNYRAKILNQLARSGILVSVRGRSGGFRLARPAGRITLADVVAPFEPVTLTRRCVLGRGRCLESSPCAAHTAWRQVQDARTAFLQGTTVHDVRG